MATTPLPPIHGIIHPGTKGLGLDPAVSPMFGNVTGDPYTFDCSANGGFVQHIDVGTDPKDPMIQTLLVNCNTHANAEVGGWGNPGTHHAVDGPFYAVNNVFNGDGINDFLLWSNNSLWRTTNHHDPQGPNFPCPDGQAITKITGNKDGHIRSMQVTCDYPVNCDGSNPWNGDCDKYGITKRVKNPRDSFCSIDANVNSSQCQNWCTAKSQDCTLFNQCKQMSLTGGDCNQHRVNDLTNQCATHGLTVAGSGTANAEPCSQANLDSLNRDCNTFNVPAAQCSLQTLMAAKATAAVVQGQKDAAAQVIAQTQTAAAANVTNMQNIAASFIQSVQNVPTPETAPVTVAVATPEVVAAPVVVATQVVQKTASNNLSLYIGATVLILIIIIIISLMI